MKKYLRLLPVMIFPYAYLIFIGISLAVVSELHALIMYAGGAFIVLSPISAVYSAVMTAKGDITSDRAAAVNLTVKGVQIPAYIFHFLIGAAGTVMSVWGIGLIMLAVVIDISSIILTGIYSVGCAVRFKRENVLTGGYAALFGICSFLFCIDIAAAVIMAVKARKKP